MKQFLALLLISTAALGAHAEVVKKEFKCSVLADYSVYLEKKMTGATTSYDVLAFCLDLNDQGLESCQEDGDDDTDTCYDEFSELNEFPQTGDSDPEIIHGR